VRDRKVLHLTNLDPQLNAADIEVNVLNNHLFHVSGLIFQKHRKTILTFKLLCLVLLVLNLQTCLVCVCTDWIGVGRIY
jgi:hypothetical protein